MTPRLSPTQRRAARIIARGFDVPLREVLGPTRGSPRAARARQALMFALWVSDHSRTKAEVGRILGRSREAARDGISSWTECADDWGPAMDSILEAQRALTGA